MKIYGFFLSFVQKKLLDYPNIIIAPSEYAKKVLVEKYKVNPDSVIVLHNGVKTK